MKANILVQNLEAQFIKLKCLFLHMHVCMSDKPLLSAVLMSMNQRRLPLL